MYMVLGLFLGTYGLAWMHHLVHKYDMFNTSIVWKEHLKHHGNNDPEHALKQTNDYFRYSFKRVFYYLTNLKRWGVADYMTLILCLIHPPLFISVVVGLFVAENIAYLQHDYSGYPVNFTNRFDNFIGLNAGAHAEHHNKPMKHKVGTQIFFGLLCTYVWGLLVILLYPTLKISTKRANVPGVYAFGFLQNVANYKAENGESVVPLLYKTPSFFDNPGILWQHINLIFTGKVLTTNPDVSHDISDIRNMYNHTGVEKGFTPTTYNGRVWDGHHRFAVSQRLRGVK